MLVGAGRVHRRRPRRRVSILVVMDHARGLKTASGVAYFYQGFRSLLSWIMLVGPVAEGQADAGL